MKSFAVILMLAIASGAQAATIVEIAQATPDLSTLVAAVEAAGLVDALNDPNTQLTVFAPTNDAFAAALALLDISAEDLLADQETLTAVLLYHVIPGAFKAADLTDGQVIQTLLPAGELTVIKNATGVFLQPSGGPIAQVTTADVEADNGIVHIIDGVLLPATAPGPAAE